MRYKHEADFMNMQLSDISAFFDGNDFVAQAEHAGAAAALLERQVDTRLPSVQVADTRLALCELATVWRRQAAIPVVGITGSNGKTTVKEMAAAILNNVGAAHIEGFGDIDGVARAKGELVQSLGDDGIAVLNADDGCFEYWQ